MALLLLPICLNALLAAPHLACPLLAHPLLQVGMAADAPAICKAIESRKRWLEG